MLFLSVLGGSPLNIVSNIEWFGGNRWNRHQTKRCIINAPPWPNETVIAIASVYGLIVSDAQANDPV